MLGIFAQPLEKVNIAKQTTLTNWFLRSQPHNWRYNRLGLTLIACPGTQLTDQLLTKQIGPFLPDLGIYQIAHKTHYYSIQFIKCK